jgi:cell division cycle 2-like protein
MAEAPTAARKRPAPEDGVCLEAAAAAKKRARYQFASINDYKKLEVLGEGSYSVVFEARHQRTGEKVAVKWIRGSSGGPDRSAVFREAGCLAACRGHPSIVQIKDVATNEATGDLFIVMELVGSSLRDLLTRPLSEDQTRVFMRQLLDAAKKLHGTRTLHRDIKPENILVAPGGELKICDFGCATPMRTPYEERRVGTLQYCSPEQLMGSRCYGAAVDMWALGCVMAELLTGQPLFEADTEEDVLGQITDLRDEFAEIGLQAFDVLPELSQAGREVLAGLLRFDPGERLTAADALDHPWFKEDVKAPGVAKAEYPGFVPLFSAA